MNITRRLAALILIAAAWAAGSPERASAEPLDRSFNVGTDVASFYLFHPDDLQHRLTSPLGWANYHFAYEPESAAGRLVGFDTGGDGGFRFRVTDGPLTAREKKWSAGSWDYRLTVKHGRVFLDGGDSLPSDDYIDETDKRPEQWITLPNGDYKTTVHAIDAYSEPGALDADDRPTDKTLPSYVIQFTPVKDLSKIKPAPTPVRLEGSQGSKPAPSRSFAEHEKYVEESIELSPRYPVLVAADEALVPGFHVFQSISDEFYAAQDDSAAPDHFEHAVIATNDKAPCLGFVCEIGSGAKSGDEPWTFAFTAKRMVTVTAIKPDKKWSVATVKPLKRPTSKLPAEQVKKLKAAFAQYAAANEGYRKGVKYPDFEAERVASIDSPEGLTNLLIHHVQMPSAERLKLLPLSDADRAKKLLDAMK